MREINLWVINVSSEYRYNGLRFTMRYCFGMVEFFKRNPLPAANKIAVYIRLLLRQFFFNKRFSHRDLLNG